MENSGSSSDRYNDLGNVAQHPSSVIRVLSWDTESTPGKKYAREYSPVISIPPALEEAPRLKEWMELVGFVTYQGHEIPLYQKYYSDTALPEPVPGKLLIVSALIAEAYAGVRND